MRPDLLIPLIDQAGSVAILAIIGFFIWRMSKKPKTPTPTTPVSLSALPVANQMLVEQRVTNEAPSIAVAYLLCIFLGWVSAHRFYLGRPGTAVLQILSWCVLVAPIWWIVDLFLIPGMVRAKQEQIRTKYAALLA